MSLLYAPFRTVSKEEEVEALGDELRRYWRRAGRALDVHIEAQVKKELSDEP